MSEENDNTRESMSSLPTKSSDPALNASNGNTATDKGDSKVKKGDYLLTLMFNFAISFE